MSETDPAVARETTLQLIRQALRSRNLNRLKEAFERPWSRAIQAKIGRDAVPTAQYRIFELALKSMKDDERKRAFQWTWDCYHPLMSDLGKVLEDMDGYIKEARS